MSKGLIAAIVAAVVLIGGAVAAMFIFNSSSPKASYFKAELDTINFVADELEKRYEPEMKWNESTMEKPVETTMGISANYNGPSDPSMGMDIGQIINNSTITLLTQSDMPNKEIFASLAANIAGMNVDNFNFYITNEDITLELPFIDDLLQVKDEDFGSLLYELDPHTFTGEEELNLNAIFENPYDTLADDMEHFKQEYFDMIYEELSDDSFTSEDETVEVLGESIDAEKIVMNLTEEEVKELIILVLDKMQSDETLKQMIRDELMVQSFGGGPVDSEIDDMLNNFESSLEEAKQEVADLHIPNGLISTLWIHDDLIVQREFSIGIGSDADDLVSLSITGDQLFTDESQLIDYEFAFSDGHDEGSLFINGGFNWKDNQGDDNITINIDDMNLIYESTETLEDNNREFERTFRFEDSMEQASFYWNGNANYETDRMNSEHEFSFEMTDVAADLFALYVNIDSQVIDGVNLPEGGNIVNLGEMSQNELFNYFESDVYPAFEEWLYGSFMNGGDSF